MSGPPAALRVLALPGPARPRAGRSTSSLTATSAAPATLTALAGLPASVPAAVTVLETAPGGALPDPSGHDAVAVDLALLGQAPDLGPLVTWVERGGSLLVVVDPVSGRAGTLERPVAALTGLSATVAALPDGEWFATVAAPDHPVVRRAPPEFPVAGSVAGLAADAGAHPLLTVSVGFRPVCALAEHRLGAGRVVTAGLCERSRWDPGVSELGRVLARALRPVAAERPDEPAVGVGIVGYGAPGGMGHAHGLAVQATAGLELVAACDPSAERRKDAERQFPEMRAYAELGDLLQDGDVAVAVVATPPTSHVGIGLELLRRGRHVVMEKPLCFTVAEVDELEEAAAAAGASLTVHHNRRWDTDFGAVRGAVETGMLGELFNVETFVGGFDHPCRAWHSEASVSGGAAYDWGSHHLDWILLLLGGAPARVTSTGHKRVWHDVTNLDQQRIHLWWPDGREAQFVHSDVAAVRRPKFYLQGTAGTLVGTYRPVTFERVEPGRGFVAEDAHHAEAPADLRLVTYAGSGALAETALPLAPERPFAFHRNLADHVHDGAPLAVSVASVRPVIGVLEAARRSAGAGGTAMALPETALAAEPSGSTGAGPA
jgi:predicted dehydrogenase